MKISQIVQRIMETPFIEEELTKTTKTLAKGKSPCPYGLTVEFFQDR